MAKITSLADLQAKAAQSRERIAERAKKIVINVSLGTCSIAAGGAKALTAMKEEVAAQNLGDKVEFVQSGCMTFCYAEPTVEITLPGKEPVLFGYVNEEKAKQLITDYVMNGTLLDGVIPVNYERVVL